MMAGGPARHLCLDPAASSLLDADARETFASVLGGNFCVSAGAGVGKTTAIVRRIANLALQRQGFEGNKLSRLVVVTYGKLAAEELRIRTRDLVLQHLHQGAAGRQTLLADLRGAFFGTIHSFCLKLIRDEGRYLGLPENINLLEEREAGALWERFTESDELLGLSLPTGLLERVGRHLSFDELLALARQFGPDDAAALGDFDADAPYRRGPILPWRWTTTADVPSPRPACTRNICAAGRRNWRTATACCRCPNTRGAAPASWRRSTRRWGPYARWLNAAAAHLAAEVARAFTRYRLDKGLMTFADQVYWCRRLVDDPVVLNRLRLRGYIVILDEAQDTDAEMFSILTEITRPIGGVPGAWPTEADAPGPEAGRFCFVGDDQQAIYGERADLAVYRRYIDAYVAGNGGSHLEFSVTMRCPVRVVGAVNGVFEDGRLDQSLVHFRPLDARPACPEGAAWRLDLGEPPPGEGRVDAETRRTRECELVADFVAARGLAGLGIARWSEVAVIAPRVRWLETAARIFEERGLPTCLLSQRQIARAQARHSWPAALLHVLVHPWDRFELVGVLREMFAVSDVDLGAAAPAGGGRAGWERVELLADAARTGARGCAEHPVAQGADHLARNSGQDAGRERRRRRQRHAEPVRRTRPGENRAGGTPAGHRRAGRLPPCAPGPRAAGGVRRTDPARLGACAGGRAGGTRAACAGAADAVQFLTCLKAKGLEWPVVIPLALGCEIRERTRTYPRLERQGGRTDVHFSSATADSDQKLARTRRQAEEFQRMLYVTLTRAKRLLVVPDGSRLYERRAPNFLGLARWDELNVPALFAPPPEEQSVVVAAPTGGPSAVGKGVFKANKRRLSRAAKQSQAIPRRILPSGLVHAAAASAPRTDTIPDGEDDRLLTLEDASLLGNERDEPLAGIGGIEYGNWWHALLQRYPWQAGQPGRERYLSEQRGLIADAVDWVERADSELARLSTGPAHAEFLEMGKVFLPEMPFSYPRSPGEWIEGHHGLGDRHP